MAGSDGDGQGKGGGSRSQRGVKTTLAMAKERLSRGDARSAEALCREAHGEHGADSELLALLGRALTEQGRFDDAAPFLAQAISLDRGDARAHRDLGEALLHGGRAEVALVMLQRARRLSKAPLPGLDALIERARDATERDGLTVIATPDEEGEERTVILRLTDPSARALTTAPGGDEVEGDQTLVLDGPPAFGSDPGFEPDLTDPAGVTLAGLQAREEDLPFPTDTGAPSLRPDPITDSDDEKEVLYLGPAMGAEHARARPAPTPEAPPVLEAGSRGEPDSAPGATELSEDDTGAGEVLAGLAAAMPEARGRDAGRLEVGVDDVLNAVLGGRLLAGPGKGASSRSRPDRRRLLLSAGAALSLGLLIALGVRLSASDGGGHLPGATSAGARMASDTREALGRLINELASSESEVDRLVRAHALALRLAHHGGEEADARTALDLLAILPPESTGSLLGLATLAELRVAAPGLSPELGDRLGTVEPGPEALLDALSFVAQDRTGEQPPRARALAHRSLARLALAAGDLSGAARQLEATLRLAPDDPGTHRTLLRLAGRAGASREIEAALTQLRRIDPRDLQARGDEHLWQLSRGEMVDPGARTELAALLTQAIDPLLVARTELVLAVSALEGGDPTAGEQHLAAAAGHPRGAWLGHGLRALAAGAPGRAGAGVLELELGRLLPTPGEAWPFLLESEALAPLPAEGASEAELEAFLQRVERHLLLRNLAGGAEASPAAPAHVPEGARPEDRLLAAHLHLARGESKDALAELPRPRELPGGESGPAALASQLLRGLALHADGQLEGAEGALGSLSRAGYQSLPALEVLARLRLRRGESAPALGALDDALVLAPARRDLGLLRVIALHRLGRPDESSRAMTALRKADGEPLSKLMQVGDPKERAVLDLYLAMSEPEPPPGEMEKLLRRALKGDADLVDAHFHLGRLLARLDRSGPAKKALGRYLAAAPEGLYAETARALVEELR